MLLDELGRALAYPKVKERITAAEANELLEVLTRGGIIVEDSEEPPTITSPDPDDNYLIALASSSRSLLVSGDNDLLGLSGQLPVHTPVEFLALLEKPISTPDLVPGRAQSGAVRSHGS
jgi:predicted nucleic acid-binding protein